MTASASTRFDTSWWHRLLTLFFLLLVFEGAIRKWLVPDAGVAIQVLRDVIPALALVGAPRGLGRALTQLPDGFRLCLLLYVVVCIAEMFNPLIPDATIAVLGLRTHLAYIPLFFLMPLYMGTKEIALRRFRIWVYSAVPVMVLAVVQTTLPYDHWLNTYASGEASSANFGAQSLVRATGTFAYITGMQVFAQATVGVAWAMMLAGAYRESWHRYLIALALAAAITGAFATGSRGAILGAAVTTIYVFGVAYFASSVPKGAIILASIAAIGVAYGGASQIEAFTERTAAVASEEGEDLGDRLFKQYFEALQVASDYPLGRGIGTAHQQAARLMGGDAGFTLGFENELTRVGQELGIAGFFLYLLLKLSAITYGWRTQWRLSDRGLPAFAATATAVLILGFSNSLYTPIANALFWGGAGVAHWLWIYRNTFLSSR